MQKIYHSLVKSQLLEKNAPLKTDMEKGMDMQTLPAEIFVNFGNFWIVEGYSLLMWIKTL